MHPLSLDVVKHHALRYARDIATTSKKLPGAPGISLSVKYM